MCRVIATRFIEFACFSVFAPADLLLADALIGRRIDQLDVSDADFSEHLPVTYFLGRTSLTV